MKLSLGVFLSLFTFAWGQAQTSEVALALGGPVHVHIQSAAGVSWQTSGVARLDADRNSLAVMALQERSTEIQEARLATLIETMAPPPVPLADFSARRAEEAVTLSWTVVPLPEAAEYLIQRSSDRQGWRTIGMIASADHGTPLERYAFTDPDPAAGTNYYRLIQVMENERAVSDMVAVEVLPTATHITHLYPQPFLFGTAIILDLKDPQPVRITIVDPDQQPIAAVYAQYTSVGRHRIELDLDSLPQADYLCEIVVGKARSYRYLKR
ncbi:MAG: hypothetical protein D6722_21245 [Bacteroidetes bacterium]|nr:MAG: hypothetical protein D6722_21245 [Bacteroidota bacterium]